MPPIAFLKTITPVLNSTTNSTVLTYSIAPGDFVIVCLVQFTSTAISFSVTDDGGNTYAPGPFLAPTSGPSPYSSYLTFATHAATAITITVSAFTTSWTAGAITYSNVGSIGNTGTQANTVGSTNKTITGTLRAASNWMAAMLGYRSTTGTTTTSGNLRAFNAGTTQLAFMDNTGTLTLTCSLTTIQTGVSTGLFIELLPISPNINTISPGAGNVGTTVPVTITGTNLSNANSINLSGTGITVSNLVVVNDSTITANFVIAAAAPLGTQQVSITTPGGTSGTIQFNVVAANLPIVNSISPAFGVLGTTLAVTISGMNFVSPASVHFAGTGVTASNVVVVNSTTITATVTIASNANIFGRSVTVTTPNGTSTPPPFVIFAVKFVLPRNRAVIKYGFSKRRRRRELERERPKGTK